MAFTIEPPPLPGDQVGDYRLGDMLGVGGMATVYKATHPSLGLVALKVLHPGKADTDEARRFRREFLTLRELDHPSVVRVFEAGQLGAYPWLAMEYVDGENLGTLVERWEEEPPSNRFGRVTRLLRDLCEALQCVHDRGLVHRDLKPTNVLVTRAGRGKLTDFGVVKDQGGQFTTQLTVAGKLVGTVAFMAPEQITGEVVDGRTDLYSLGACLYVMLTGKRPIVADTVAGYLARHLTEQPAAPSSHDPRVPLRLERICLRLLEKEPDRRFQSAGEVLAALDADASADRPPLYGRDAQVNRLRERVEDLEAGRGGMVVVQGSRGSGRTLLLAELRARVQDQVQCLQTDASQGDLLGHLTAQLPSVPADDSLPAGPARLVARLKGSPRLVLVDDVDRIGAVALEGLTSVVRELLAILGEPILFVVTLSSREGPVASLATGAATGLSPESLLLSGLDRRSVIAIIRDQGVEGAVGVTLGRRLHDELRGNPFAIIEQVEVLRRAGWLNEQAPGILSPARPLDDFRQAALPVPTRVRMREEERLDQLDADARQALNALLVLGVEVTSDLVADVLRLDMGTVEAALDALQQRQWVRGRIEGVQEIWGLNHDHNAALLLGLLPSEHRAALHRAAAAALKRRARRRSGALTEMIAGHLLSGGQVAEAYPLLIQATRRKLRSNHLDTARRLLRQALEARSSAESRLATLRAQTCRRELFALEGEVLERCGDLTGALGAWERALSAASAAGEGDAIARARSGLGLVRAARGEADAAADGLEQAIAELPMGDPLWTRVAQALATARLVRGNTEGAASLWRQLEEMGDHLGGSLGAEARMGQALVAMVRGDLRSGRSILEEAETRLRALDGGRLPLARTLVWLAEIAYADGHLVQSAERAEEAGRIARGIPRIVLVVRSLGVAALSFAARGDLVEARRLAREGAALVQSRGRADTAPELLAVISIARGLCAAGETEEAASLLPPVPSFGPTGLEDPTGLLLAVRARALADRSPVQASEDAWGALGRMPAALPWQASDLALDAAIALLRTGDPAADAAVAEALERTEGPGNRLHRLAALRLAVHISDDPRLVQESEQLRVRLHDELGRPPSFLQRWR